jgi:hypothetical protein
MKMTAPITKTAEALTARVASMSPEQRYARAREIAALSTTRDLSREEHSEFVKYFFGTYAFDKPNQ